MERPVEIMEGFPAGIKNVVPKNITELLILKEISLIYQR
ncbi:MAG: hypothetical protein ACD_24C00476G0001 [uncultured bacterium]|nr:MAG: hypothetical protein ACD_24C00476G0001 [uncultured bacterium]